MSSNKDKIRDWFFALPEEQRNEIEGLIEQIREREEAIETHEQSMRGLVRKLARIIESLIDDPSQTSMIIKAIANGRISDEIIEKALPEEKKRKHKPYELFRKREIKDFDFQDPETVTVSTSGGESYTKPDGNEGEREAEPVPDVLQVSEQATEIALSLADQYKADLQDRDIRLNEALTLADDKDKRIYELELKQGELELEIDEFRKKPLRKEKDIEKIEELEIENDNLKLRLREVEEIEREKIRQSAFTTASHLPKRPWIAALDAMSLYVTLRDARDYAINHNDPWRKILFDAAEDGRLSNARLEGDAGDASR